MKNYEESAPEFLAFVDGYASGRNDAALSGMILQLYEFSRSYPWPKKWLLAAAESYGIEDEASLKAQLHAVASSELKTGVRGSCGTFRAGIQTDAGR